MAMESSTLNLQPIGKGMAGRPNCLILDEVDGADAKGAIQALVQIIKAEMPSKSSTTHTGKKSGKKNSQPYLRRPIIFVCNHKYWNHSGPIYC